MKDTNRVGGRIGNGIICHPIKTEVGFRFLCQELNTLYWYVVS